MRVLKKAAHEIREFAVLFAYFAVVLGGFAVYQRLLLSSHAIDCPDLGASAVAALVLAKVVLIGEGVGLGERFADRSLFVRSAYKSVLYSVAVFVVVALERLVSSFLHGQSPANLWSELRSGSWHELVARAAIVLVSFLPLFALRETLRELKQLLGSDETVSQLFLRMPARPEGGSAPARRSEP
jgi:hypothetical protein